MGDKIVKNNQLGLPSIIWMGFNFIAGITFTASFSSIIAAKFAPDSFKGVGIHILWIFLIEGIITFFCAWSFARLVEKHPKANGGASQYARTAFGKFWGLNTGMLNFFVLPLIASNLLITMVKQNFGESSVLQLIGPNGKWRSWGSLYLDLISFAIFMLASAVILLGVKKYKIIGNLIGYLTWILTIGLITFSIIAFAANLKDGVNGLKEYSDSSNIELNVNTFSQAFTTCFFAFAGIETFITTGNSIKNREKNMPIAIIVIMILTTSFYIMFTILTMGAVVNGFGQNPNIELFGRFEKLQNFGGTAVIICTILMRFNSTLQISLFGGSVIEPLSQQGFVSEKFKKNNKDNLPVSGIIAAVSVYSLAIILFLIIPDIIEGITQDESPFNYSTVSQVTSILLIAIYITNITVVLFHSFKRNIKFRLFEVICWILCLAFLIFEVGYWFYGLFHTLIMNEGKISNIVGPIFQIFYLVTIVVTVVCIYFIYHKKEIIKISSDKEKLAELVEYEKVFTLIKE